MIIYPNQKRLTDFALTKELAIKYFVSEHLRENRKGKGEKNFPLEVFK